MSRGHQHWIYIPAYTTAAYCRAQLSRCPTPPIQLYRYHRGDEKREAKLTPPYTSSSSSSFYRVSPIKCGPCTTRSNHNCGERAVCPCRHESSITADCGSTSRPGPEHTPAWPIEITHQRATSPRGSTIQCLCRHDGSHACGSTARRALTGLTARYIHSGSRWPHTALVDLLRPVDLLERLVRARHTC